MRKPLTAALLLVIPLVLLAFAGASQAQLVLYDDFNVKPHQPRQMVGERGQRRARRAEYRIGPEDRR